MIKEYIKEDLTIVWDDTKCTHSGNCVRGLGKVFNPKLRPWINTDNASKEAIRLQVGQCPSEALSIKQ